MNNLNHEFVLITHLTANPTNKAGFDIDKEYVLMGNLEMILLNKSYK